MENILASLGGNKSTERITITKKVEQAAKWNICSVSERLVFEEALGWNTWLKYSEGLGWNKIVLPGKHVLMNQLFLKEKSQLKVEVTLCLLLWL